MLKGRDLLLHRSVDITIVPGLGFKTAGRVLAAATILISLKRDKQRCWEMAGTGHSGGGRRGLPHCFNKAEPNVETVADGRYFCWVCGEIHQVACISAPIGLELASNSSFYFGRARADNLSLGTWASLYSRAQRQLLLERVGLGARTRANSATDGSGPETEPRFLQ